MVKSWYDKKWIFKVHPFQKKVELYKVSVANKKTKCCMKGISMRKQGLLWENNDMENGIK